MIAQATPAIPPADSPVFRIGDRVRANRYTDAPISYGTISEFYTYYGRMYARITYEGGRSLGELAENLRRPVPILPAKLHEKPAQAAVQAVPDTNAGNSSCESAEARQKRLTVEMLLDF